MSDVFMRTYLVRGEGHLDPNHPIHHSNAVGAAHEAVNQGWRPADRCSIAKAEVVSHTRRGVANVELTYAVPVVRATEVLAPAGTETPAEAEKPAEADSAPKKAAAKAKAAE